MCWIFSVSSVFFKYNFFLHFIITNIFMKLMQTITTSNRFLYQTIFLKNVSFVRFILKLEEIKRTIISYFSINKEDGSRNRLPLNILKRVLIIYYSINYHNIKIFMTFLMKKLLMNILIQ